MSPLVRKYTATDIPALIPLLRKNVFSSPASASVTVTALDWTLPTPGQLRPLLTTLGLTRTALATPQRATAVVVAELRAEDVLQE
ncbi:hypothetical protein EDB89DRAFT_2079426 [Lactarius sanguifluus]|nr:hypothetical protein EDB89DRAFT_2079426 [Lactarius sanguifluus]